MTVPGDPSADEPPPRGPAGRAVAIVLQLRNAAFSKRARPWLLACAAVVFVVVTISAFSSLPDLEHDATPVLALVLVFVATPLTVAGNALEYQTMGALLDHRIGFFAAARLSLLASIANYLPAPGGIAVRTASLTAKGSTARRALWVNLVATLFWAAVAAVVAGALLTIRDADVTSSVTLALGVAGLVAGAVLVGRLQHDAHLWWVRLVSIELLLVLTSALRIWIAMRTIGAGVSVTTAVAIGSSAVLAAAVGIFPAGLGLRELIAGGIAAALDESATAAIAATSVDRVAAQVGIGIVAVLLGVHRRMRPDDDDEELDDDLGGLPAR